ncbi:hypothetical protein [Spirosoma spitsbergense]|uniref:hypothetical protein n=1 Tax=Spirosoma spitsbergense TaxID=431554 RepID=UPI00035F8446|nr:hypothetical protein [Spirosoma spitsbergense]
MDLKDTILTVNGCQFEMFQDKIGQQELDDRQETLQNELGVIKLTKLEKAYALHKFLN